MGRSRAWVSSRVAAPAVVARPMILILPVIPARPPVRDGWRWPHERRHYRVGRTHARRRQGWSRGWVAMRRLRSHVRALYLVVRPPMRRRIKPLVVRLCPIIFGARRGVTSASSPPRVPFAPDEFCARHSPLSQPRYRCVHSIRSIREQPEQPRRISASHTEGELASWLTLSG